MKKGMLQKLLVVAANFPHLRCVQIKWTSVEISDIALTNSSLHVAIQHSKSEVWTVVDNGYCVQACICSPQFANLHNFEIVLHKLEVVKFQTKFEIAQPLFRILEMCRNLVHE